MLSRNTAAGLCAGVLAALVGGCWQVVTRQSTTTTIAPADLALLRYGIPALVLLPVTLRVGLWPRGVSRGLLVLMIAGAGLPFGLIAMSGTRYAPVAHMGVLMAGASPLFATALAFALLRERPGAWRIVGLGCMAAGLAVLGAKGLAAPVAGVWRGDALFLLAAAVWTGFTLSFRRTGLTAWQGAAIVNSWSALLVAAWLAWNGTTRLPDAPVHDIIFQGVWQGVIAGVLGLWFFAVAITRLGAARAASFGALVPIVSALGGWWWLGETLTTAEWLAVSFSGAGVMLASGVLEKSSV